MASSTALTETKTVGVILELSNTEAEVLISLLAKVGGLSTKSARKHTDAIYVALREIGVDYDNSLFNGNIAAVSK